MRAAAIRKLVGHFRRWPVHPQWLLHVSGEERDLDAALARLEGNVLDVGCAGRRLASRLASGCMYTGLDYPDTATAMYRTRPDVFGDACRLPFADGSFDAVILKVGTLDDPSVFGQPGMAIFTIDKQAFHVIPEGLPAFERFPG